MMDNNKGVNKSKGVNRSDGVNWSHGANESWGVNWSDGVNWSHGVNESYGANRSQGVTSSYGVNLSKGVTSSYGANWAHGVNLSYGVNRSDGVNVSYGVLNSSGVSNEIFCADKEQTYRIFGELVTEERYIEVWRSIRSKADGWFPEFNNAFKLWRGAGKDWKLVDASKIESTLEDWEKPYEAWKDIPKELLEYIKSLPEFKAELFERVTGIDVTMKELLALTQQGK